jgi:hypothetical protein
MMNDAAYADLLYLFFQTSASPVPTIWPDIDINPSRAIYASAHCPASSRLYGGPRAEL